MKAGAAAAAEDAGNVAGRTIDPSSVACGDTFSRKGRRGRHPAKGVAPHPPTLRVGPALSRWERGYTVVCPRNWRERAPSNQRLVDFTHPRMIRAQTASTMIPPRREERARGQRPIAAAGGGRAGTGPRGILGRSGDLVAGQARPPSAWSKAKGCVTAPLRPPGACGNAKARLPVRPEHGHPSGRWRITTARSVRASSKR